MSKSVMFIGLCLLVIPVSAVADASIVQEYCEQYVEGSDDLIFVHFSIVNYSLPEPVGSILLIPEPLPPWLGCEVVECLSPGGWDCQLSALGGAGFWATELADIIAPGNSLSGFAIVLPIPEWCCYLAQFDNPDGTILLEQEECFTCTVIPDEQTTWGAIKRSYR